MFRFLDRLTLLPFGCCWGSILLGAIAGVRFDKLFDDLFDDMGIQLWVDSLVKAEGEVAAQYYYFWKRCTKTMYLVQTVDLCFSGSPIRLINQVFFTYMVKEYNWANNVQIVCHS